MSWLRTRNCCRDCDLRWLAPFGETLDPHSAVGYAVAQQHRRDKTVPMVVLATAHPAKFPETIRHVIGIDPSIPESLKRVLDLPEKMQRIEPNPEALKRFIAENV